MSHVSRFKRRDSDRSGFTFWELELKKDAPWLVHPDEYDTPSPSKKSLGGEGDISGSPRVSATSAFFVADTAVPTDVDNPVVYVTAAGGITPSTHPFMLVTGSNVNVDITANPQITRGKEGQVLTLFCTDSRITLDHGTGLNMLGSAGYAMRSGDISVFFYHTGGTVWDETSRQRAGRN